MAREVSNEILRCVALLETFPYAGKAGEVSGTRELVVSRYPAYIVVYHLTSDAVEIWHIWHGAQNWR